MALNQAIYIKEKDTDDKLRDKESVCRLSLSFYIDNTNIVKSFIISKYFSFYFFYYIYIQWHKYNHTHLEISN